MCKFEIKKASNPDMNRYPLLPLLVFLLFFYRPCVLPLHALWIRTEARSVMICRKQPWLRCGRDLPQAGSLRTSRLIRLMTHPSGNAWIITRKLPHWCQKRCSVYHVWDSIQKATFTWAQQALWRPMQARCAPMMAPLFYPFIGSVRFEV